MNLTIDQIPDDLKQEIVREHYREIVKRRDPAEHRKSMLKAQATKAKRQRKAKRKK